HSWAGAEPAVFMHFTDKVLEHFFGDLEVGNNTVFQWTNRSNISGRTAQHSFRFSTYCFDDFMAIVMTDGHHGGLVKYNPAAAHINQCIGCTEINRKIV